ncbi:MAG: hypothetical protein ABWY82_07230 [Tardiphaga sp.]
MEVPPVEPGTPNSPIADSEDQEQAASHSEEQPARSVCAFVTNFHRGVLALGLEGLSFTHQAFRRGLRPVIRRFTNVSAMLRVAMFRPVNLDFFARSTLIDVIGSASVVFQVIHAVQRAYD